MRACSGEIDGSSSTRIDCTGSVPKVISFSSTGIGATLAGSPPFVKRIRYADASGTRVDLLCIQFGAIGLRGWVFDFLVAEAEESLNAATGCVNGSSSRLRVSMRSIV